MEYKRLYKSSTDKAIFGVCGGIAEYLGIDSLIIRLVLVLFTLAFGAGLLFYIIAALLMPKRPEDGGMPVQPERPGSYNAGGATYVNRASYAQPMPQEVTRSTVPQEVPAEPADPMPQEVPAEPADPVDPVSAAWAKERETQETRGAAAGAPKEEPAPKAEAPKAEPKPEQPQAKRSYET
ncbi:MAG: PspC domain-containing protein, partial [Firmicutes bacterium]|nr:PspC domain-containing protein [Bacillota bacterium]